MINFAIPFPEISPDAFTIPFLGFGVKWYALAYIVGILIGWRLVVAAIRSPRLWLNDTPVMDAKQIEDMLTWIILGVILGGRLGYVIFYNPSHFLANPAEIPMLWQGGMAFHGGLLGVILAAWLYTRAHGINRLSAADAIALGVPPGLFLGRLANFVNGELWGRMTELPWGVQFTSPGAQDNCASLVELCARHPSQIYEAILEGLILGLFMLWLAWRRDGFKKPGLLAGTFFAGYGIGRFIVEFFRQPDAQFISEGNPLGLAWHIGGYGLTQGQNLSLPMIALGLFLVARALRRA